MKMETSQFPISSMIYDKTRSEYAPYMETSIPIGDAAFDIGLDMNIGISIVEMMRMNSYHGFL